MLPQTAKILKKQAPQVNESAQGKRKLARRIGLGLFIAVAVCLYQLMRAFPCEFEPVRWVCVLACRVSHSNHITLPELKHL